jgi:hypothetical protein
MKNTDGGNPTTAWPETEKKVVAARQIGMTPAGYAKRLAKALENKARDAGS